MVRDALNPPANNHRPPDARRTPELAKATSLKLAMEDMAKPNERKRRMIPNEITDAEFDRAYEYLAKQGTCDSPGGMEYRRVKSEWLECRPAPLPFIEVRANLGPVGRGDRSASTEANR